MNLPANISPETTLARYETACRAVAAAVSIDEAKDFRDKAEAMRAYARQAKNRQMETQCAEIRIRAERRIGELIGAQRDAGLLNKGLNGSAVTGLKKNPVKDDKPTLAESGIDKNLADRARKLAAIPEDEFNDIVDDWRGRVADENERVTTNLLDAAKKHVHVSANSGNNEWYTPPEIIEAARAVLGGFDLDPASSEIANRTVKAERFFTAADDGLAQEWPLGRIWMNPPYAQPLIEQFAQKYCGAINGGSTGIVLVNNATETGWFQMLARSASAICFPKSRVRFFDPDGNPGAPLQGQSVLYSGINTGKFSAKFSRFGFVVVEP